MSFDETRVLPGAGGGGSPGGGAGEEWEGHLVVYVPKAQLIADLTLDQANDLEREVFVIPRVKEAPPAFWSGEPVADRVGDCSVFYRHTPTDQDWRRSENWAGHRQVAREMVAVLAGAVRARLVTKAVTMTPRDEPYRSANATAPDRISQSLNT